MEVNSLTTTASTSDRTTKALQELKDTAGQVVGSLFYGTLLQQMRESNLKGDYGHGGRGEEAFAGQLHGMLAEKIGKSDNNPLGQAIYESMKRQQTNINRGQAVEKDS